MTRERQDNLVVDERLTRKVATAGDLTDKLGAFLRGKVDRLREHEQSLETRRLALAEEDARLRSQLHEQVIGFVALVDSGALATSTTALAQHASLLAKLGLTPDQVLAAARRARR